MLERVLNLFHRVANAESSSGFTGSDVADWTALVLDFALSAAEWSDRDVAATLRSSSQPSQPSQPHVVSIQSWGAIAEAARRAAGYTPSGRQLEAAAMLALGETAYIETAEDTGLVVGMAAAAAWTSGVTTHLLVDSDERADRLLHALAPLWTLLDIPHAGMRGDHLPDPGRGVLVATPNHVIERLAGTWWAPMAGWAVPTVPTLALLPEGSLTSSRQFGERVRIGVYETLTPEIVERAGLVADRLKEGRDFRVDRRLHTATLTETGIGAVERRMNLDKPADSRFAQFVHQLGQAMLARACYQRDVQYVVVDDEVVPLDVVSQKPLAGRRFQVGLHEALERNGGLPIRCLPLMSASMTSEALLSGYDRVGAAVFRGLSALRTNVPSSSSEQRWGRELSAWSHSGDSGKYLSMSVEIEAAAMERRPVLGIFRTHAGARQVAALLAERGIPNELEGDPVEGGHAVIRAMRSEGTPILWVCPRDPSMYRNPCSPPPALHERLEALLIVAETQPHQSAHHDVPCWLATPLGVVASYRRHVLEGEMGAPDTAEVDDAGTSSLRNLERAVSLRQARSFRWTNELRRLVATSDSSVAMALRLARPEIARLINLYLPEGSTERWDRAGLVRVLNQYHPTISLPDIRQLRRLRPEDRVQAVMGQLEALWADLASGGSQETWNVQLRNLLSSVVDAGAHQLHGRLDNWARTCIRMKTESPSSSEGEIDQTTFDREAAAMEASASERLGQEVLISFGQLLADRHQPPMATSVRRDQPKVGRNELCPCGSGKKYKRCCGLASATPVADPPFSAPS